MRARAESDAHVSVLETVIVGVLMLGAIVYFMQVGEPRSDEAGAHQRVETFGQDALSVLASLPPSDEAYLTLLDELVDQAYDGNPTALKTRLDRYFPPGVSYNVYLNDGRELTPLIEAYTPTGPTVSVTRLVNKVDGIFLLFPEVENVAGTDASNTLRVIGVPLRNGFYYPHLPSALTFENAYTVEFEVNQTSGLLVADGLPPELVASPNGYATQYDKSSALAFTTSVTTYTALPAEEHTLTTNTDYTIGGHPYYSVQPSHLPANLVSSFLNAADYVNTSADRENAARGSKVNMTYNYDFVPLTGWAVGGREMNIYSPKNGSVIHSETLVDLAGTAEWDVPEDAAYGTYVCEFKLTLVQGTATQLVRDLALFHVTSSTTEEPLPPVYRIELVAWLEGT